LKRKLSLQNNTDRKLLLQQQACTSSESDLAEKNKVLTCDMYMYRLRHIHDPVLSSLKMEGILLIFKLNSEAVTSAKYIILQNIIHYCLYKLKFS
jgi:hypothetical protein